MIEGEKNRKKKMENFIKVSWKDNFLLGILHHMEDMSKPTLLFIHGIPGERVDTRRLPVRIARELCKYNINSLRMDFYASGISEGDYENVTFECQKEQVECVVKYMRKQLHLTGKIILVAFSEAAKIANAVARNNCDIDGICYCNGIIAEEQIADSLRINRLYRRNGHFVANIGFGVWINSNIILEIKKWSLHSVEELSKTKSLFIYGDADDLTYNSLQLISKSLNDLYQLKIISGADHLFTSSIYDEKIISEICKWIKKEYAGR
jgi:alpha/beta superfamily hydrolase